jgi:hypothetical protein
MLPGFVVAVLQTGNGETNLKNRFRLYLGRLE